MGKFFWFIWIQLWYVEYLHSFDFFHADEFVFFWTKNKSLWATLTETVETEFGLLDKLYNCGLVTYNQRQQIKNEHENVKQLLICFEDQPWNRDKHDKLLDALNSTKQQHVAELLQRRG